MKSFPHGVKGIDPVADAFAGTVYSDVYSMSNHNMIMFVIYKGVGTTGTSTITVEACDDTTPSTTSAITFHYQAITSGDTHGALTAAATTGFTTTAGSSQLYLVYAEAEQLASSGYEFIRLKAVEVVNAAVEGCIFGVLLEPKYDKAQQASVLS